MKLGEEERVACRSTPDTWDLHRENPIRSLIWPLPRKKTRWKEREIEREKENKKKNIRIIPYERIITPNRQSLSRLHSTIATSESISKAIQREGTRVANETDFESGKFSQSYSWIAAIEGNWMASKSFLKKSRSINFPSVILPGVRARNSPPSWPSHNPSPFGEGRGTVKRVDVLVILPCFFLSS